MHFFSDSIKISRETRWGTWLSIRAKATKIEQEKSKDYPELGSWSIWGKIYVRSKKFKDISYSPRLSFLISIHSIQVTAPEPYLDDAHYKILWMEHPVVSSLRVLWISKNNARRHKCRTSFDERRIDKTGTWKVKITIFHLSFSFLLKRKIKWSHWTHRDKFNRLRSFRLELVTFRSSGLL